MSTPPVTDFNPPTTPLTPVSLSTDFKAGDFVDNLNLFQVVQLIGQGKYGKVYKCNDLLTKKEVAVKVETKAKSLRQEHKIYMKIRYTDSNDAVPTYEGFNDNRIPFFMVLSLEGKCFAQIAEESPEFIVPEKQILALAYHGLKAFKMIHKLRIVHRDVRMQNICLSRTEGKYKVLLLDFGLSVTSNLDKKTKIRHYRSQGTKKFFRASYASVRVEEKNPIYELDDIISFAHMLLDMRLGWDDLDKPEIKKQLMADPEEMLKPGEQFMAPFLKMLYAQPYNGDLPDHEGMMRLISETPGFDIDAYDLKH